jgi:hypothetical protein
VAALTPLIEALLARTLLLNGIFRKYCLECAMLSRAGVHLVLFSGALLRFA